jgi:NadR type nicotinamide-nucleotide adenylyltransferase
VKKIVIIGPESTGKSSLCTQLAKHFNGDCVPEYAREYLREHGRDYSYDDLLKIAQGQVALEDQTASSTSKDIMFLDTDMNVMRVWCEFVFGKCHDWILNQLATREYDFYLLCRNDLPWEKDDLREYPDEETREKLFRIYYDIMLNQEVPFAIVEGNHESRFKLAVDHVSNFLLINQKS